ncbi:MAG: type I methionyl aminopeptidase [Desulfuromonadaceae bacterium]|nr:type I methionyl aminopeptidase [Desulfuromonadaceae bacterium]MDD5107816.1 type I methionyl aminopeptidase [Desulfuromonadaceae bacterium]
MIILKSHREIEKMKTSSRIVAEILESLRLLVVPGVTTYDLNRFASAEASKRNVKCAFKGYHNYPGSLCCSPNNQVVHGLPNKNPLVSGDILSLDFGVICDDFYGDAAVTVPVGEVSDSAKLLISATEASLYAAIGMALPGNRLGDVSSAVQQFVEGKGYSVVRDFVGHGIGKNLHEDPQIPNYGSPGKGVKLKVGMVLAIEPMVNEKAHDVKVLSDNWTVVTCDGGLSAHFEHTVAVTENGPEILSRI